MEFQDPKIALFFCFGNSQWFGISARHGACNSVHAEAALHKARRLDACGARHVQPAGSSCIQEMTGVSSSYITYHLIHLSLSINHH